MEVAAAGSAKRDDESVCSSKGDACNTVGVLPRLLPAGGEPSDADGSKTLWYDAKRGDNRFGSPGDIAAGTVGVSPSPAACACACESLSAAAYAVGPRRPSGEAARARAIAVCGGGGWGLSPPPSVNAIGWACWDGEPMLGRGSAAAEAAAPATAAGVSVCPPAPALSEGKGAGATFDDTTSSDAA